MKARALRLAAGVSIGAAVVTGASIVAPLQAGPLAPSEAVACSASKFRITWDVVGVRESPSSNAQIKDHGHGGETIWGPHGGTENGWTAVDYYVGPNYARGYIPVESRDYLGCV